MKTLTTILGVTMIMAALASAARAKEGDDDKTSQQAKSFEKEITIRVKLNYLLYLPHGYEGSNRQWPLVLFLHGAGESGENVEKVKAEGLPKLLQTKHDFPFVVVSPQSRFGGWNTDALNALLDEVITNYQIDQERVYLTGLSMGGFGTWELACTHPERFAAIAPICGGGYPSRAKELRNMPVWAFHGARDRTVPVAHTEAMIKAIQEAGSAPSSPSTRRPATTRGPRLTTTPSFTTGSWSTAGRRQRGVKAITCSHAPRGNTRLARSASERSPGSTEAKTTQSVKARVPTRSVGTRSITCSHAPRGHEINQFLATLRTLL